MTAILPMGDYGATNSEEARQLWLGEPKLEPALAEVIGYGLWILLVFKVKA